ncbi:MAG: fibronectin type III-like domain-contianing protein, partial [Clostridia bacterium]|nr:fibronectin type III-like domain-contianing protein [Clostridia bacterium]
LADTPTGEERGNGFCERYTEGLLVGYRWYDTLQKNVLFPFGHGLSYASFAYSDLAVEKQGDTDFAVSFTVTNTSGVAGKEIAQLYVRDVFSMVERPEKELRGFAKIALAAGESRRVTLQLDARAFAYYSTALDEWYVENGDYEILLGASSRDIRLAGRMTVSLPEETQFSTDGE